MDEIDIHADEAAINLMQYIIDEIKSEQKALWYGPRHVIWRWAIFKIELKLKASFLVIETDLSKKEFNIASPDSIENCISDLKRKLV